MCQYKEYEIYKSYEAASISDKISNSNLEFENYYET